MDEYESSALPAHAPRLMARYLGSEVLVIAPDGAAHALSGPVATVWRAADPSHCDAAVRHALGELSDADVATATMTLMDAGLVVARRGGLDRRALLHRAGAVGGLTVGAYLATVVLPAAQASASTVLGTRTIGPSEGFQTALFPVGTTSCGFTVVGSGGGGAAHAVGGSGATYTGRVTFTTTRDERTYIAQAAPAVRRPPARQVARRASTRARVARARRRLAAPGAAVASASSVGRAASTRWGS